jgi:beta-lactamase superfamily II metal-dependent hydrolase
VIGPAADELEVTVFGPGYGESVVVHLGQDRWIVIDSCIDSHSERPAVLAYFERIGVDPAGAVKLVIATHWHDDHVGGLSELLGACDEAEFACAAPLANPQFLEVMAVFNKRSLTLSSGLSEIQKVYRLLMRRKRPPRFVMGDMPLLRLEPLRAIPVATVTALSPVNSEYLRFLQFLGQFVLNTRTTKYRFPDPASNDLSIAAWVEVGGISLLLGADLEEHEIPTRGWSAVLSSTTRPMGLAVFFKVPHHGSINGHHDGVWTGMMTAKVSAVLTPWNRGRKLPQRSDCERISALAYESYATSRALGPIKPRPQTVQKTLRESQIKVTPAEPPTGFVTLRAPLVQRFTKWTTTTSSEACHLRDYR